jgi:hypothetical protein
LGFILCTYKKVHRETAQAQNDPSSKRPEKFERTTHKTTQGTKRPKLKTVHAQNQEATDSFNPIIGSSPNSVYSILRPSIPPTPHLDLLKQALEDASIEGGKR